MLAARRAFLRSGVFAVLALAALVTSDRVAASQPLTAAGLQAAIDVAGAAAVLVAGLLAVRGLRAGIRLAFAERTGDGQAAAVAGLVGALGYVLVGLAVLGALGLGIEHVLVGGAVTGIIVGIAAQQTLGNFFAGIVLLLRRPICVGEQTVIRSSTLDGEYSGRVTDVGLFYVTLETDHGPVALPNSIVLESALGPGARKPQDIPGATD
ncbi:MAG: mechanosensitive ion channel domain-containing protein [Egibacteraceae bacterium]